MNSRVMREGAVGSVLQMVKRQQQDPLLVGDAVYSAHQRAALVALHEAISRAWGEYTPVERLALSWVESLDERREAVADFVMLSGDSSVGLVRVTDRATTAAGHEHLAMLALIDGVRRRL